MGMWSGLRTETWWIALIILWPLWTCLTPVPTCTAKVNENHIRGHVHFFLDLHLCMWAWLVQTGGQFDCTETDFLQKCLGIKGCFLGGVFVATTVSYFQQNWQQETHFRWVTSLSKAHRAIESDIKVNDCSNRGQIVFRTTHDSVPTRSWTHQIRPWASGTFILKESHLSKTEAGFTPQISMANSDRLDLFDFFDLTIDKCNPYLISTNA